MLTDIYLNIHSSTDDGLRHAIHLRYRQITIECIWGACYEWNIEWHYTLWWFSNTQPMVENNHRQHIWINTFTGKVLQNFSSLFFAVVDTLRRLFSCLQCLHLIFFRGGYFNLIVTKSLDFFLIIFLFYFLFSTLILLIKFKPFE